MNPRYKFVSEFNETVKPKEIVYYYQLASFKDPKTNKYNIRRFTINENDEFIDVKETSLNSKEFRKFIKTQKPNKYKVFSVYTLDIIQYPTLSDISLCKSEILSKNNEYYGYAPF